MIKVKIFSVGKHKHSWLDIALKEYEERLTGAYQFEWILLKDNAALEKALKGEKALIALDPNGKQHTSESFSAFTSTLGSRMSFCIGGSEGLTPTIKQQATCLISLSKLTFTHQITRLVLLEQIYRADQIQKQTAYHK